MTPTTLTQFAWKPLNLERAPTRSPLRVGIQAGSKGAKGSAPRLDISFSRDLGSQFGITAARDRKANVVGDILALYHDGAHVLLCTPDKGLELTGGQQTRTYIVGSRYGGASETAFHIDTMLPPACVSEKRSAATPPFYEVRDGALLIRLPDSFLRTERPEAAPVVASDSPQRASVVESRDAAAAENAPRVPYGDGAGAAPLSATETTNASAAGVSLAAPPVLPVQQEPRLEDRLYDALLQVARDGQECPGNRDLGRLAGVTEASAGATLSALKSQGRIAVRYIDRFGIRSAVYSRGAARVVTLVKEQVSTAEPPAPAPDTAGPHSGESGGDGSDAAEGDAGAVLAVDGPEAKSASGERSAAAEPAPVSPRTPAPAPAPPSRAVPMTPVKGRRLSEAEQEVMDLVRRPKPAVPEVRTGMMPAKRGKTGAARVGVAEQRLIDEAVAAGRVQHAAAADPVGEAVRFLRSRDYEVLDGGLGRYRVDGHLVSPQEVILKANRVRADLRLPPIPMPENPDQPADKPGREAA